MSWVFLLLHGRSSIIYLGQAFTAGERLLLFVGTFLQCRFGCRILILGFGQIGGKCGYGGVLEKDYHGEFPPEVTADLQAEAQAEN